ncbi:MAG: hypothetical protein ACON39_07270 [Coraliomargaritaceae bacterium]
MVWISLVGASLLSAQSEAEPTAAEGSASERFRRGASSVEREPAADESSDVAGIRSLLQTLNLQAKSMDWRGKQFNLGDIGMAQARFEKYLNSPPLTTEDDLTYDTMLTDISERLIGRGGGTEEQRIAEAWRMLYRASDFPIDAGMSEILADRIVSFWQMSEKIAALNTQTNLLETDREYRESKIRSIADKERKDFIDLTRGSANEDAPAPPNLEHLSAPERKRLNKIERKILENEAYEATSRVSQKLEYQSLVLQFFVQRRFQHALIANDFYRYIFSAEENTLEGAEALRNQVFGDLDVKITTSTLDTLAKEAIADVDSSLQTIDFLLEQGEVQSAAKRLLEAFYLGEYLPAIKRYPLEKKRKIGAYIRDLKSLASALEVKSFERAENKLKQIEDYVTDFDVGRADAFIQTSKQLSNLAVRKALTAAYVQDRVGIEDALAEAVEYWPTNPEINEFAENLLSKTDLQDMASMDFDRFVRQKDFRAIFNERFRFAAALALDLKRNPEFLDIMKRMEAIESAMAQARELARIENTFGAWEVLERVYREHSDDQDLNRMRGDYAVEASAFASIISRAEKSRSQGDFSRALFAYLEARGMYPASFFVEEGIRECVSSILESERRVVTAEVSSEEAAIE